MSSVLDKLKALSKQLNPRGRAFLIPFGSVKQKIDNGILPSEERLYNDALSVLNSILPDNPFFTTDDATRWEQRLGMIVNESAALDDRKAAIIRKMNHPGTILARQSRGYIEDQLRLAGFDVYVYENIPAQTPQQFLLNNPLSPQQLGGFQLGQQQLGSPESVFPTLFEQLQLGNFQLGQNNLAESSYNNKIANRISEEPGFYVGNPRRTFFIGGATPGSFAQVPLTRKDEFRSLILHLKPAENVGYLLVYYT